jgi:hypothetical protein
LSGPDQNRAIQALLYAIKPLVDSGGPIPFPYMLTFLTVALEEGKPVGAYGRELNFSRFQISRYMRCISDTGRDGTAGLGLVTIKRTSVASTKTAVFLTDKGRAIASQVYRNLRSTLEVHHCVAPVPSIIGRPPLSRQTSALRRELQSNQNHRFESET